MAKTLVIVESPSKAKTIEKYLGKDFEVHASVGHIRDLPKSNKQAIDIEGGFIPHYEIVPGKGKVIAMLKRAAGKADVVVLATDPDREGEAIAWHVAEALGLNGAQRQEPAVRRIVFHEITKEAVTDAMRHPRSIDENLRRAQEARRVLDRLVGYDLSGLIWKKVRYGLSAGRVQSPALRILAEREREIGAFIPEDYFVIVGDFKTQSGAELHLTSTEEPKTKERADAIIAAGTNAPWAITGIKETEASRAPRAPLTTSTLPQTASSRFGYSPKQTMRCAQKLYEAGHITYMRTDSVNLSATARADMQTVIANEFGKEFAAPHTYATKSKNVQEAHEAIRPPHASVAPAGSTEQEQKLYTLIRGRTLGSQMADAKILRTKIVAGTQDVMVPPFVATGQRTLFPGWLLADPAAQGEDVEFPALRTGDQLTLRTLEAIARQTQPPQRYSEAGLVKELERRGIGRPSTYATIVETLKERGYVVKEGKALRVTDTGDVVSSFLEEHFPTYISDTFTSEMENELDEIARGERPYEKTLRTFYTGFNRDVRAKEKLDKATNLGAAEKHFVCPKCGGPMVIKLGRSGKFLSCARFPACDGALTIDGNVLDGPKKTGETCPKCGKGELIERDGKYGRFIACERYPKCKFVKKDPEAEKARGTGVACPVCKKGNIVEKRGRFGLFYACSNYPSCTFTMKSKPTGAVCNLCGALMMEGTKTIPERCSNKECPNHRPHKKSSARA